MVLHPLVLVLLKAILFLPEKDKLRAACLEESELESDPSLRSRYRHAAESISSGHVVMAFVAPEGLRKQKQRHLDAQFSSQLQIELQDPSNWQPLGDLSTFGQHASVFGFSSEGQHTRLLVREGSQELRTTSSRYRRFVEDQKRWSDPLSLTNTEQECFGYAVYLHPQDGNSKEWRQALIARPGLPNAAPGVQFLLAPPPAEGLLPDTGGATADHVLPAPALPRIFDTTLPEHAELLARAPKLQKDGKTEEEIHATLNQEQFDRWHQAKIAAMSDLDSGQALPPKPPDITMREVRMALRKASVR